MGEKLVLPILNKSVSTFKGPTLYLSDQVTVETISPEEYSAVFAKIGPERAWFVTPRSKCIKVNDLSCGLDLEKVYAIARNEATKTAFVLNFFKDRHPVALSVALKITEKRKARLDYVLDLSFVGDVYRQHQIVFKLRGEVCRENISRFYQVLTKAHDKHPNFLLTLGRFNGALVREELCDRIVDISICLESLIEGSGELRQRFAMYNAWAAEADVLKRYSVFELLCALYDTRSAIVHGDSTTKGAGRRNLETVSSKWDEIVRLAARALGYHIFFLHDRNLDDWPKHQKRLVLGLDARVV